MTVTRFILAAAVLLAASLVAPTAAQKDKLKGDKKLLQGGWRATALEMDGKRAPEAQSKDVRWFFVGDTVLLSSPDTADKVPYQLDETKKPKTIDLVMTKELRLRGIYELKGDDLKVCLGPKERPRAFKSSAEQTVLILKRDNSAEAKQALQKAATAPSAAEVVREAAERMRSQNNLKLIGLALHNHHGVYNHLPAAAIHGKDGKPLLSWRVAVLPFLEHDELYKKFKLDEAWDGPHNRTLLKEMPKDFALRLDATAARGETFYQVFVGPGTLFDGPKGLHFKNILDGTSNTLLVVEAARAVPWTKPEDLPYAPDKPLPKLGGHFKKGFHALTADGAFHLIKPNFDEKTLRLAITRADGQPVDLDKLQP